MSASAAKKQQKPALTVFKDKNIHVKTLELNPKTPVSIEKEPSPIKEINNAHNALKLSYASQEIYIPASNSEFQNLLNSIQSRGYFEKLFNISEDSDGRIIFGAYLYNGEQVSMALARHKELRKGR